MNKEKAREILGDWIRTDNTLYDGLHYISCGKGNRLDGDFTNEQLEAVAWWVNMMGEDNE